MTGALILTPDQARAVVGERCDGCTCRPGRPHRHGCTQPENDPVARFIPSDTPDRYQPGEWIEVRMPDVSWQLWNSEWITERGAVVGRVRLGEVVPVHHVDLLDQFDASCHGDECIVVRPGSAFMEYHPEWDGAQKDDEPVALPTERTLWPHAFASGTWAHPIIERSPK